jgi:hypothetical protein
MAKDRFCCLKFQCNSCSPGVQVPSCALPIACRLKCGGNVNHPRNTGFVGRIIRRYSILGGYVQARSYICQSLRQSTQPPRLGDISQDVQSLLRRHCSSSDCFLSMPVILEDDRAWQSLRIFNPGVQVIDAPELEWDPPSTAVASTAAVGMFGLPINCAEPSPDGKWLAVLSDMMTVFLLPEALDYALPTGLAVHLDKSIKLCAVSTSDIQMVYLRTIVQFRSKTDNASMQHTHQLCSFMLFLTTCCHILMQVVQQLAMLR